MKCPYRETPFGLDFAECYKEDCAAWDKWDEQCGTCRLPSAAKSERPVLFKDEDKKFKLLFPDGHVVIMGGLCQ